MTDPSIGAQARACARELARPGGAVHAAQLIEELVGDPLSRPGSQGSSTVRDLGHRSTDKH